MKTIYESIIEAHVIKESNGSDQYLLDFDNDNSFIPVTGSYFTDVSIKNRRNSVYNTSQRLYDFDFVEYINKELYFIHIDDYKVPEKYNKELLLLVNIAVNLRDNHVIEFETIEYYIDSTKENIFCTIRCTLMDDPKVLEKYNFKGLKTFVTQDSNHFFHIEGLYDSNDDKEDIFINLCYNIKDLTFTFKEVMNIIKSSKVVNKFSI